MGSTLSMSGAQLRAERLRRVKQHIDELPPGRQREELRDQLEADSAAFAASTLAKG